MTWIFLIIATIGYVLNIKDKKIESYIVWFISNICWMIYGFSTQQYAMAVMFIVYTLFTIYGMYHENLFGKWYIQYPHKMNTFVSKLWRECIVNKEFWDDICKSDTKAIRPGLFVPKIKKMYYTAVYEGWLIAQGKYNESNYV